MLCVNLVNISIIFHKKYSECKDCHGKRGFKRYYENKDKRPNQPRICFEENKNKLLQKQNGKYKLFKELFRNYVESENRLKALEENN